MAEFMTHLLFSSPRLRFSESQKRSILSWATALGADGLPSLHSLCKTREWIKALFGDPTEKVTASSGNIFYLNSISKAIAMDYANPLMHFSMQDYAEDGQGQMSQDYFIPKKFFQVKLGGASEAEVLALGHSISKTEVGYSVDPELFIVPVSTFARTYKDIKANGSEFSKGFTAAHAGLMPNPLREKSGGRMVLMVPLIVFMDDVSGNISKQWNKHHVVYMSNASMPRDAREGVLRALCVVLSTCCSVGIDPWGKGIH
ncbi:hypothetical protein PAXRUDRAFT_18776 [Paxillus rubicundulus Ve08.2h10]|uniref:Uncharacterized protein n=1 Tax=Paxillus rubicundulus Ve08.2h10 TaxID=930991 RepID=A0A0D0BWJ5_9AGAM|nr:hypothetical protein PAXRUDRAFT_18776 [Paxillus rubicundulus Ve08.2h10]